MKTILAVLIASLFLIGGASAQPPAASSTATMRSADAKHGVEIDKHIKDLHAKLKITPAEESRWATVAQTMRENANELDQAIEKRESNAYNATAIDDLERLCRYSPGPCGRNQEAVRSLFFALCLDAGRAEKAGLSTSLRSARTKARRSPRDRTPSGLA